MISKSYHILRSLELINLYGYLSQTTTTNEFPNNSRKSDFDAKY